MANFTTFNLKTPEAGDFLVGYKEDGSEEFKTTVSSLIDSLSSTYLEFINVQTYGAIGDGINDDSIPIQQSIDSASENQTIYFPEGNYKIDSTIIIPYGKNNLRIISSGSRLFANDQTSPNILKIASDDVLVEGLVFDGNYTSGSPTNTKYLLELNGQRTTVKNCVFKNTCGYGITARWGTGITTGNGNNSTIYGTGGHQIFDNKVTNCWSGINVQSTLSSAVSGLRDISIQRNNIIKNSFVSYQSSARCIGVGLDANCPSFKGIVISNNVCVNGGTTGIEIFDNSKDILITGNYVEGGDVALSLSGCNRVTATGNHLIGSRDYQFEISGSSDITATGNFMSGKNSAGQQIGICGFNINSQYQSASNLTLNGNTIVNFEVPLFNNNINANNVTFTGNTIYGSLSGINGGIKLQGNQNNWLISNNSIKAEGYNCDRFFYFTGTGSGFTISNNQLIGAAKNQVFDIGGTIYENISIFGNNFTAASATNEDFIRLGLGTSSFNAFNNIASDYSNPKTCILNTTIPQFLTTNLTATNAFISDLTVESLSVNSNALSSDGTNTFLKLYNNNIAYGLKLQLL